MKMFIERQENLLVNQVGHFYGEVSNYVIIPGTDSGKVIILKKANTFLQYIFPLQTSIQNNAHSFTSYKNQAL